MISARETDHDSLSNKLKVSRDWQQGVLVPAQVQMIEKWRQLLPLRMAMQEQLFREPGQRKVLNQFNGPAAMMKVSQVVKLVDVALQKSKQTKVAGHGVSGLFPM